VRAQRKVTLLFSSVLHIHKGRASCPSAESVSSARGLRRWCRGCLVGMREGGYRKAASRTPCIPRHWSRRENPANAVLIYELWLRQWKRV